MAVNLSSYGGVGAQFLDNAGNVLSGGKIFTYAAGTTTNQETYTSSAGNVFHSNPIILDASGRVPGGEIWLLDTVTYKFVLKTSTDVLIATYDNIPGINSNFLNFIVSEEIQVATAGQTVFNLSLISYSPNTNNLQVFVDGINQYDGTTYNYNETNSSTVTFTTGLSAGAVVKFTTAVNLSSNVTDASLVTYDPPFTNSTPSTVKLKLAESVSVKDFGAIGNGIADDTLAIQNALNQNIRRVFFPAGQYRITSTLTIQQDAILEGDGGSNELNSSNITMIQVDGNFDGMRINPAAPSYYGWLTMKRITINKTGGVLGANTGLVITNFAPHVVLESVACWNFATGFDLFIGLAQLNSCEARWCMTSGFNIKGTSFVIQNCYAKDGGAGYVINDQTVYSTLISCAADNNLYNAYEFRGTTGPFTGDSASSIVRLQNCGAEIAARYMYVDGNFDIEVTSPSIFNMSAIPSFALIESAKRIMLRNIGGGVGLVNWINFNQVKCDPDVIIVEGDMPHYTLVSPPATSFPALPIAQVDFKTLISSPSKLGLAKTRIPSLTADPGASSGVVSTIEKGVFVTPAVTGARLRFRSNVLSNGFMSGAKITCITINSSNSAAKSGGEIYLQACNPGGVNYSATTTNTDLTIVNSTAVSPNGTYVYFDIYSSYTFAYLWEVTAYTNFEDLATAPSYNNWTVSIL